MQSSITSSAEQALGDSEQRQQLARRELEERMVVEKLELQRMAAEEKSEVGVVRLFFAHSSASFRNVSWRNGKWQKCWSCSGWPWWRRWVLQEPCTSV